MRCRVKPGSGGLLANRYEHGAGGAADVCAVTLAGDPAVGCTHRWLPVERSAPTIVIDLLHMLLARHVSLDCSIRASLSSALAAKTA
jgi:hypothetical protein